STGVARAPKKKTSITDSASFQAGGYMSLKTQAQTALLYSLTAFAAMLATSPALKAQPATTTIGTIVSSSRSTLTVRESNGHYQLYTFERATKKPADLPLGAPVRVVSK